MIMLDLLPQVEQIIQQKAQAQGVTKETLAKMSSINNFCPMNINKKPLLI